MKTNKQKKKGKFPEIEKHFRERGMGVGPPRGLVPAFCRRDTQVKTTEATGFCLSLGRAGEGEM